MFSFCTKIARNCRRSSGGGSCAKILSTSRVSRVFSPVVHLSPPPPVVGVASKLSRNFSTHHKNKLPGKEKLIVFDTTLRDGEQSPGVVLTIEEKLTIARQLSLLGVDVCEAGFPIASQGDFDAVQKIAHEVGSSTFGRTEGPMTIAALCRSTKKDIDRAFEAIKPAPKKRIHAFLATSDIHLKHKLKISREECIEQVSKWVTYARSLCEDVEFSPEDAGRTDLEFLAKVLSAAISAGATTLNIPDTVGYTTPEMYGSQIKYLIEHTKGSEKAVWSTHCHNDLGLATANSLAGIWNGARQVEVAMNGIGERAGNTALEEVVMAIYTHRNYFPVYTSIDTTQIMKTSRLVSALTGMLVQPNKAVVGANAFAHESGIHQDGVLKHQSTYEIMEPSTVGLDKNLLVMGKHSGRHAFSKRLEELGFKLSEEALQTAFKAFKNLADSKKEISDWDLIAIARDESQTKEFWKLNYIQANCGDRLQPTATVSITSADGSEIVESSIGVGPVDAVFSAINKIIKLPNKLNEYTVKSVTDGLNSLAEVVVSISPKDGPIPYSCLGTGANGDVIVASARAFVSALNKLKSTDDFTTRQHPQRESSSI